MKLKKGDGTQGSNPGEELRPREGEKGHLIEKYRNHASGKGYERGICPEDRKRSAME